jgi:hypothetical protein
MKQKNKKQKRERTFKDSAKHIHFVGRVQWARAICVIFTDAFPKTVGAAVVSVAGKSDARATNIWELWNMQRLN